MRATARLWRVVSFPGVVAVVMAGGMGCSGDTEDRLRASLCGEPYELREDKSGRTVRLDTRTGDVTVLTGDRLVKVRSPQDEEAERIMDGVLAKSQEWPEIELKPWETRATLTTSWRDGQLHYQLSLLVSQPLKETIARARSAARTWEKFELVFHDEAGFKLLSVDAPLVSLVRNLDESGAVTRYVANESVACTRDIYSSIRAWDVLWNVADKPTGKKE